jgi:hypothetical protein
MPENPLEFIFEKQREVFYSFMKLEGKEMEEYSFDINCGEDQQLIKDFLQIRFIEELTEATVDWGNRDHFKEEMADAFNFLVEAYILYGYGPKDLNPWLNYVVGTCREDIAHSIFYGIVERVGKTCNLLKNRPWKHSQYLVDLYKFEPDFKTIWRHFNTVCCLVGISFEELFKYWSLKYQVNLFRLRTKY